MHLQGHDVMSGISVLLVWSKTGPFVWTAKSPTSESTVLHLTFPDPLEWNFFFPPVISFISSNACRQIGCVPEQRLLAPISSGQGGSHPAPPSLMCWPKMPLASFPYSPFSQSAHSHSSHKSLKRAPDFNARQLHQYWCGRKVFQSRLSHTTLILIVLCTSLDIWCHSKIVMVLRRVGGLKGDIVAERGQRCLAGNKSPRVLYMVYDKPRRTHLQFGS